MGVGRIFFQGRGHKGIFLKFFQGGTKSGKIFFFPLKTKQTTFFTENFKIQGGLGPLYSPSDAYWCSGLLHSSPNVMR